MVMVLLTLVLRLSNALHDITLKSVASQIHNLSGIFEY